MVDRQASIPKHVHIVGIGGIGMSAIARVLAARGHVVTGSDLHCSDVTRSLNALGIRTYEGHRAEQVSGAELVAVSSAVPEANPEITAARAAGIPVMKRQTLLGLLLEGSRAVAVAGTHGKTTTSAMIAVMLEALGQDPSAIVGGIVTQWGANARAGQGPDLVIEADEYDRCFLGLHPHIAVVTNIEMDHPDCYADLACMREAYAQFLMGIPEGGWVVACADSPALRQTLREAAALRAGVVTYGREPGADCQIIDVATTVEGGTGFAVKRDGREWLRATLAILGEHNVLNATAALLVIDLLGLDLLAAARALADYRGVARRLQVKGEAGGVTVVDDYAHHPTEIRATLAAVRRRYPGRRVVAVFQPHTYSRLAALYEEFLDCFADADVAIILDVYAARAREVATLRAEDLAHALHHPAARYLGGADAVVLALGDMLKPGDVLITLGAGDGYLIGERVLAARSGATRDDR